MSVYPLQWLHAYREAPWRIRRQWLAALFLGLLTLLLLGWFSLQASLGAALLGREIQSLRAEASRLEHLNADLQVTLAAQTRLEVMQARALALGFHPADPQERQYLRIPGYLFSVTPSPPANKPQLVASLPPEYTQSLWDWMQERFLSLMGGAP